MPRKFMVSLLIAGGLSGCSPSPGPARVDEQFYRLISEYHNQQALSLISAGTQKRDKGPQSRPFRTLFASLHNEMAQHGGLRSVHFQYKVVHGDHALVTLIWVFHDGMGQQNTDNLVYTKGHWLIQIQAHSRQALHKTSQ